MPRGRKGGIPSKTINDLKFLNGSVYSGGFRGYQRGGFLKKLGNFVLGRSGNEARKKQQMMRRRKQLIIRKEREKARRRACNATYGGYPEPYYGGYPSVKRKREGERKEEESVCRHQRRRSFAFHRSGSHSWTIGWSRFGWQ